MSYNPAKYELLIRQYLRPILDINADRCVKGGYSREDDIFTVSKLS